jgi:hypothetical protein
MNNLRRLTTQLGKQSIIRFNFSDNFSQKEKQDEKIFIDKEESKIN